MGEGISADDGLVGLHWHIHQRAYHAACGVYLCCVDVCLDAEVGMCLECHRYLLERCVSGTLSYSVYCHLDLSRSSEHSGHGIGGSHAEVIMAVGGEDGLAGREGVDMLVEILYLLVILIGEPESCGVRNITYCRSGLCDGVYHTRQILIVCASGILGVELDILNVSLGMLHGSHGALDNLLWG